MSRPALATLTAALALVAGCAEVGNTSGGSASPATRCWLGDASPVVNEPAAEGIDGARRIEVPRSGQLVDGECPNDTTLPPVDGPMAPMWANCGFYDRPVPAEAAVHSMYNGAVWIAYSPELAGKELEAIRATATSSSHVLASPVASLPSPIVVSSWQRQLELDTVRDTRFDEFITAYLFAPHRPVIYASCRDGSGAPVAAFVDGARD